ncbi:MAG: uridine kinase [Polyangia bacterium]|nr:uridine kinase [Polyangia bacterium]
MNAPILIGIAGGTGAGKTTIARKLQEPLPPGSVTVIEHDAYYRDRLDLRPEERARLNYDHPDALDNDLFESHLRALKAGESVERPVYDFVGHRRLAETVRLPAHAVVIVEGILIFVEKRLRDLMDIKLFVDTPPDVRVLRRIKRDLRERGRDFDSVRRQYYESVRPMHLEFVEPTKQFADLIIPEGHGGNLDIALDVIVERMRRATR